MNRRNQIISVLASLLEFVTENEQSILCIDCPQGVSVHTWTNPISDNLKKLYNLNNETNPTYSIKNERVLIDHTLKTIKKEYKEYGGINCKNIHTFLETFRLVFESKFCCLLMKEKKFRKILVEMYSEMFKFYIPSSLYDFFFEKEKVYILSFCGDALIELVKYSLEKKDFSSIENLNLFKATRFIYELFKINKDPVYTLKYIDILLSAEQEMKPDEMVVKTNDGTQDGNATRMRNFFQQLEPERLTYKNLKLIAFFNGTRTEFEETTSGKETREFTFADLEMGKFPSSKIRFF